MCVCTPEIKTPFCGKPGCESPPESEESKIDAAARKAHAAADAAAKAWYEYASLLDVGPDRTWAFDVHTNLRHARQRF
jgi:hypothetical protein